MPVGPTDDLGANSNEDGLLGHAPDGEVIRATGRQARTLVRAVVKEAAPDELPLFAALCDAFFEDPRATVTVRGRREDAVGLGRRR